MQPISWLSLLLLEHLSLCDSMNLDGLVFTNKPWYFDFLICCHWHAFGCFVYFLFPTSVVTSLFCLHESCLWTSRIIMGRVLHSLIGFCNLSVIISGYFFFWRRMNPGAYLTGSIVGNTPGSPKNFLQLKPGRKDRCYNIDHHCHLYDCMSWK